MAKEEFTKAQFYALNGGINEKNSEILMPDNNSLFIENFLLTQTGALVERPGFEQFIDYSANSTTIAKAIFQYVSQSKDVIIINTADKLLSAPNVSLDTGTSVISFSTASHSLYGGFTSDTLSVTNYPSNIVANNFFYTADGYRIYRSDGDKISTFGIYPPRQTFSTTFASGSGGLSSSAFYGYAITLSETRTGYESNPYETTEDFVNGLHVSNSATSVSLFLNSISIYDPKVDTINIYRTFGASISTAVAPRYFLLDSVSTGIGVYQDVKRDDQLGRELDFTNYPFATFDIEGLLKPNPEARIIPTTMVFHKNRMWMATGKDSFAYYSEFGKQESFSPTNFLSVNADLIDNERITVYSSLFDELIIFRNKSMFVLTGDTPDDFVLRKISDNFGCVAPRSVKQIENSLVFYSNQGWALYTSGGIVQRISDFLERTVSNIENTMDMQAVHFPDDKMYMCSTRLLSQFVLEDSGGTRWTIQINDFGQLIVFDGGLNPLPSYIVESPNGTNWYIKVNTDGTLYTEDTTNELSTFVITLQSPGNIRWDIDVDNNGEIVSVPSMSNTIFNPIYCYDYYNKAWIRMASLNENVDHRVMTTITDADERATVLIGTTNGKILRYNKFTTETDDGTAISSIVTSKWFDFGVPDAIKIFRHLHIDFQKQETAYVVSLDIYYNYNSRDIVHNYTRTIPAGVGIHSERYGLLGNGYSMGFKLSTTGGDFKPKVYGWVIFYRVRSNRK